MACQVSCPNSTLEQLVVDQFLWLDQIQAIAEPWIGSELVALGQLVQADLPVEQGFVISAQVLTEFLAAMSEPLDFSLSDLEHPQQLQAIAHNLQQAIRTAPLAPAWLPELEAAIAALETEVLSLHPFLWIADTALTEKNLLQPQFCWRRLQPIQQALQDLWAELCQAKNLLFWQQAGVSLAQMRLAILVQPVRPTPAAGFVRPLATGWQIESSYGLSAAIALGEVIPDRYQIDQSATTIQQQTLGQKTYIYEPADSTEAKECIAGLPFAASDRLALTEPQLQQLMDLIPKVQAQLGDGFSWSWALHEGQQIQPVGLPELELRILQVYQTKIPAPVAPAPDLPKSNLVRIGQGIAAASGQAIAETLIVTDSTQDLANLPAGKILVVPSFQPEWLPLLKQSVGIICETGGMTSHGAIMARELGIPAVVGVSGATSQIAGDKLLLLDGEQGQIYEFEGDLLPPPVTTPRPLVVPSDRPDNQKQFTTQLLVNLSQTYALAHAQTLPVSGVGLLRSEVILPEVLQYHHPDLWLQQGRQPEIVAGLTAQIHQFAAAFHPRPVFYRALDLRSHEGRGLMGGQQFEPAEGNPSLGRRGVSRYVANPELFDLQLAALRQVHQAGYSQVHLLLPFVRSVEEFEVCQQRVAQAGLFKNSQMQLWLMAEVPSVLFLLPSYVRAGVQGISIGSNDLTQLILGVDREQSYLAEQLDERHPAVKAAIAQLIKTAQELGIPCTICGEAPARHPELVDWLVELGITGISVAPESVLSTQRAIAQAERRAMQRVVAD
jgi:pyruvate, water dikinase